MDLIEFLMWFRATVLAHPVPPGAPPPHPLERASFVPREQPLANRCVEYSWLPEGDDRVLTLRTTDGRNHTRVPVSSARQDAVPSFEDLVDAWAALTRTPR